jgi:two-component system CheB/CheR fusion protein
MTTRDIGKRLDQEGARFAIVAEPHRDVAHSDVCAAVIAMVGHDLRQPLQLITSAHDVLDTTFHNTEQRDNLARAKTATSQLAWMLTQLVDTVQLQEQSSHYRYGPVALRVILRQLASEFGELAQAQGIKLRVFHSAAVLQSHSVLLSGILRNLIRNAIDYTPRGGHVFVGCRRRGSEAHIEVRDSGVGIAPGELMKIFDAFHRADSTRSNGLGLGLFIVQRAAQLLAHRIEVYSELGHGSCFRIVAQLLGQDRKAQTYRLHS